MSFYVWIGIVLLSLLPLQVTAVPTNIPTLQEWYQINSANGLVVAGPVAYLPNFDTVHGGEHATAMYVLHQNGKSGVEVWYHRYKEDMEPQPGWAGSAYNTTQVDLNGDGALDYIFDFGRIIRGIKNGLPPEDSVLTKYKWIIGTNRPFTVVDLNNDGKGDVIANLNEVGGGMLFSVLVGGSDLLNLKFTLFQRRGEESFIGLLNKQAEDGTLRLITRRYDEYNNGAKKWTSLLLNEMKTWMQGDSLHISLRTLDSISLNTTETGYEFGELQSGIYRAHPTSKEYLLISKYLNGNQAWTMAYDCSHDRFDSVAEARTDNGNLHILNADINGDGYNDWVTRDFDYLYMYAGRPEGLDTVPFGRYRLPCTDRIDNVHAIGDVNNDGVRDIAVALRPSSGVDGCFAIILGAKLRQVPVGVNEFVAGYPTETFDMQQNYPNPIGRERQATIPITVEKAQYFTLELWTLGGRRVGVLHNGWLGEGSQTLDVSLVQYNLSSGMYILRLIADGHIRERAILVD